MCGALRSNERKAHRFYKIILHYLLLLTVKKIKIVKDIGDKNYQCELLFFLE